MRDLADLLISKTGSTPVNLHPFMAVCKEGMCSWSNHYWTNFKITISICNVFITYLRKLYFWDGSYVG